MEENNNNEENKNNEDNKNNEENNNNEENKNNEENNNNEEKINKEENIEKKEETQKENKEEFTSIINADFTDKRTIIDSPRSIQACLNLGIQISELIQLDLEEFKLKYPEIRSLDPDMIKYRYNAAEKFRIQSINLLKKERQRIIDGDEISQNEDNFKKTVTSMSKTGGFNKGGNVELTTDEKMEQILKEQKKAIHKIKQKQRQDIQALIKMQIDKEISEKINIEKQRRQKEKEEENNRELEKIRVEKERKLKQKEKKRISELNRQMEEQKMRYKIKEEKEQQKQIELIEAERKKKEENKKKKNIEMRKLNERKKNEI